MCYRELGKSNITEMHKCAMDDYSRMIKLAPTNPRGYFWRPISTQALIKCMNADEDAETRSTEQYTRLIDSYEERSQRDIERYLELEKDYGCRCASSVGHILRFIVIS